MSTVSVGVLDKSKQRQAKAEFEASMMRNDIYLAFTHLAKFLELYLEYKHLSATQKKDGTQGLAKKTKSILGQLTKHSDKQEAEADLKAAEKSLELLNYIKSNCVALLELLHDPLKKRFYMLSDGNQKQQPDQIFLMRSDHRIDWKMLAQDGTTFTNGTLVIEEMAKLLSQDHLTARKLIDQWNHPESARKIENTFHIYFVNFAKSLLEERVLEVFRILLERNVSSFLRLNSGASSQTRPSTFGTDVEEMCQVYCRARFNNVVRGRDSIERSISDGFAAFGAHMNFLSHWQIDEGEPEVLGLNMRTMKDFFRRHDLSLAMFMDSDGNQTPECRKGILNFYRGLVANQDEIKQISPEYISIFQEFHRKFFNALVCYFDDLKAYSAKHKKDAIPSNVASDLSELCRYRFKDGKFYLEAGLPNRPIARASHDPKPRETKEGEVASPDGAPLSRSANPVGNPAPDKPPELPAPPLTLRK